MKKKKQTKTKKEFLIIGSNNFWYATCDTLKEAKEIKRDILKGLEDEINNDYGNDESPSFHPFKPETVYIYEAIEV